MGREVGDQSGQDLHRIGNRPAALTAVNGRILHNDPPTR